MATSDLCEFPSLSGDTGNSRDMMQMSFSALLQEICCLSVQAVTGSENSVSQR